MFASRSGTGEEVDFGGEPSFRQQMRETRRIIMTTAASTTPRGGITITTPETSVVQV